MSERVEWALGRASGRGHGIGRSIRGRACQLGKSHDEARSTVRNRIINYRSGPLPPLAHVGALLLKRARRVHTQSSGQIGRARTR